MAAPVIVDLPDTSTTEINKKLDELRQQSGAVTLGRVLTLVIAPDSEELIEESIEKSTTGGRHLDLVAKGIAAITASAGEVMTLVEEVSLGSQEQERGIEQIGKAISQMEHVTQKSAANAEECASAAEELSASIAEIAQPLAVFKRGRRTVIRHRPQLLRPQ